MKRYLAMNRYIRGKIVQPTDKRTSSFIIYLYNLSNRLRFVLQLVNNFSTFAFHFKHFPWCISWHEQHFHLMDIGCLHRTQNLTAWKRNMTKCIYKYETKYMATDWWRLDTTEANFPFLWHFCTFCLNTCRTRTPKSTRIFILW